MPMDVDKMQTKLATWSQDPGFRFDDIYNLLYDTGFLRRAYNAVKSNHGSRTPGVDGQTIESFGEDLDENLTGLQKSLKSQSFEPKPLRRTYIPKGDGRKRPLGIPTIKDRIVQETLRLVLEPIYETDFSDYSFGFRPNRSAHDAIMSVRARMAPATGWYKHWIIDADIEGFFDNVDHQTLEQIIQDRITDQKLRDLIWDFLKAGIMEEGRYRHSLTGTPQGGIVSPLLANVYLDHLDQWAEQWTELSRKEKAKRNRQGQGNWHYARYADDFLLMTDGTRGRAEEMMERAGGFVGGELNLTLSEKKSRLVHAQDGLNFLGYDLKADSDTGGAKRTIPKEAVRDIRSKIRDATEGGTNVSARNKIRAVSAAVRGWGNYYKYATDAYRVFDDVENLLWHQVSRWLARKHDCSRSNLISEKLQSKSPISINGVTLVDPRKMTDEYTKSPQRQDHPYLDDENTGRERLPDEAPWLANGEERKGWDDVRVKVRERDDYTCQVCGRDVRDSTAPVHHIRPRDSYNNPREADTPENLKTLCVPCHRRIESNRPS
jgi:group II intron reverse transcriptase/maturase